MRRGAGTEQARYGLKFARRSDPVSFHSLLISPKGIYALWHYKTGRPEPFTDLLAGKAIVPAVKKRHGDRGAEVKFERLLITALPPVRPAARPVLPPVTPARSPDR